MHIVLAMALLMLSPQQPETAEALVQMALERHVADMEVLKTLSWDKQDKEYDLPENKEKEKRKESVMITLPKLFMAGRYNYEFESSGNPNQIKIRFYPAGDLKNQPGPVFKPNMGFVDRQLEEGQNQIINQLDGYLLIDSKTFGIVELEARLNRPLRVKVMTFRIMIIRYDQVQVFDIWAPKRIEVEFKFDDIKWLARLFVQNTHERKITTFSNYQKGPQ